MAQRLLLLALGALLSACGSTALEITTTALPDGAVGDSYATALSAAGGTGEGYAWSVASGALPAGLELGRGDGTAATVLSGTPTQAGRFEFTVKVSDGDGAEATQTYGLLVTGVSAPLVITTTSLPDASVESAYAAPVSAEGGAGQGYTWSITSGQLPAGLQLAAEGSPGAQITGTPTQAGDFSFRVEVDDGNQTAQADLTITVHAGAIPVSIVTSALPQGSVGAAYDVEVAASGGTGEGYQWRADGALPGGLTLDPSGTPSTHLRGAPTAAGTFEVALVVEDSEGASASARLRVEILEALGITQANLPRGRVGEAFTATIAATAGAGAGHQWSVSQGELPPGVALTGAEQPTATLSGAPTAFGAFGFTLAVTDAHGGMAAQAFTLTVDPVAVQIVTTTAAPGQVGAAYAMPVDTTGGSGAGYTWAAQGLPPGLTIDAAGAPATSITGLPSAFGTFTATISVTDTNGDQDAATLAFTIAPPAVFITNTSLPSGTYGVPYSAQILGAQGSVSDYRWSITQGSLPFGLTLSPDGTPAATLSGFPREAGTFSFTVTLVDANGQVDRVPFTLTIDRDLAIQTRALPQANVGEAFSAPLEAAGGTPPYVWTIAAGNLPAGLSLVPTSTVVSTLFGAPSLVGPARFTVQVQDFSGATDTRDFLLVARSAPQWAGTVGDTVVDNDGIVVLVDVSGLPTNYLTVNPPAPGTGDASTDSDDAAFAPDNDRLAYIGDFLQDGVSELFIVYMATGAPANPTRVSGPMVIGGDVVDFRWSPDGQRLLYTADQNVDGQVELFEVEVAGAVPGAPRRVNPTMVPGGNIAAFDFWWSPDGRWAVYLADVSNDGDFELWATDMLDPGPLTPVRLHGALPSGADVDDGVRFVPDGSGLVFLADLAVTNEHNLYYVDLRGPTPGSAVQLNRPLPAGGDVSFDRYAFSPDGRRLLYVADQDTNDVGELFVVDTHFDPPAPALRVSPPMPDPEMDIFAATWGPDSRRIAFVGDTLTDTMTELFVMDLSGLAAGAPQRVSAPLPAEGDVSSTPGSGFAFSPDGGWLAYRADSEVDGAYDLLLARMSGPTTTSTVVRVNAPLASNSDVDRFLFAPDGQRIVYRADQSVVNQSELYVVDLAGPVPGPWQQVNRPMVSGGDVTSTVSQLKWSRDGGRIYYRSDELVDNDYAARFVDVTVTPPAPSLLITPSLPVSGDASFFFLQE